jgi:hypothetical protein
MKKAGIERDFPAEYRPVRSGMQIQLEVENYSSSKHVVRLNRGVEFHTQKISLDTPIEAPAANLIVNSAPGKKCGMGFTAERRSLGKAETLPPTDHMDPRLKMVGIKKRNMRSAADEKRFRIQPGIGSRMAKSSEHISFDAKPVAEVASDIRLVAEIVKFLAQDIVLHVLKPDAELPRFTVRRNERRRSGRFTRGTAGIESRCTILCGRRERQAKKCRAQN